MGIEPQIKPHCFIKKDAPYIEHGSVNWPIACVSCHAVAIVSIDETTRAVEELANKDPWFIMSCSGPSGSSKILYCPTEEKYYFAAVEMTELPRAGAYRINNVYFSVARDNPTHEAKYLSTMDKILLDKAVNDFLMG